MKTFIHFVSTHVWIMIVSLLSSVSIFFLPFTLDSGSQSADTHLSKIAAPKPVVKRQPVSANDPLSMGLQANKIAPFVGETIEVTITARYLNLPPSLLFTFEGSNAFRLKVILPDGFVITGGTYYDLIGDQLSARHPIVTYTIEGHFTKVPDQPRFRLLRGPGQANSQSLFAEKAQLLVQVVSEQKSSARIADDCNGISLLASASSSTASPGSSVQLSASCSGCGSSSGSSTLYSTTFDSEVANSSFTTDYGDQVGLVNNARTNTGESYYCPITDHSGTGGKLLRFTGEPAGRIWEKSLNVVSGTTYTFSLWVKPMYNGTPSTTTRPLQLQINNTTLAAPTVLMANTNCSNDWVPLTVSWLATTTGSVPFTIRLSESSSWQNAFVIDDILISSAGSSNSTTYSWQALNGGTLQSPSTANTTVTLPGTAGSYSYKVTMVSNGCTQEQTVTIVSGSSTVCNGISLSASASSATVSGGSSVQLSASCSGCTSSGSSTLYSTNFDNDIPNSNFTTDFIDQVGVVPNARTNSGESYFCSITDHAGTGGKLLRFTGESTGRIWEKSLSVVSGTTYTFSFWVRPMYDGTPSTTQRPLQLQINGSTISSPSVTMANPSCSNGWVLISTSWQATTTGNVPFTIRLGESSSWVNAFALDDLVVSSAGGGGSGATYSWQALNGGTLQSPTSASTQVNLPCTPAFTLTK